MSYKLKNEVAKFNLYIKIKLAFLCSNNTQKTILLDKIENKLYSRNITAHHINILHHQIKVDFYLFQKERFYPNPFAILFQVLGH